MSDWNAQRYDRFAAPRQRPCRDLLAAVPPIDATRITDLGCGTGLSTALLAARWPHAAICAIDNSPDMLEAARRRVGYASFKEQDIRDWHPDEPQDLILANASLQWLPGHRTLLPALLDRLEPGGVLAVQMPNNLQEPSHVLLRATADRPRYREHMHKLDWTREELLSVEDCYDCLAGPGRVIDIWETRYHHVLPEVATLLDWFASTALKPFLDALPESEHDAFRQDYLSALEDAYARRRDEKVLLGIPRRFIVAQREK